MSLCGAESRHPGAGPASGMSGRAIVWRQGASPAIHPPAPLLGTPAADFGNSVTDHDFANVFPLQWFAQGVRGQTNGEGGTVNEGVRHRGQRVYRSRPSPVFDA